MFDRDETKQTYHEGQRMIDPSHISAINEEFRYQEQRWGKKWARQIKTLDEWLLYIGEYAAQARAQTTKGDEEAAHHTVRKIAALAINVMQDHGVRRR